MPSVWREHDVFAGGGQQVAEQTHADDFAGDLRDLDFELRDVRLKSDVDDTTEWDAGACRRRLWRTDELRRNRPKRSAESRSIVAVGLQLGPALAVCYGRVSSR